MSSTAGTALHCHMYGALPAPRSTVHWARHLAARQLCTGQEQQYDACRLATCTVHCVYGSHDTCAGAPRCVKMRVGCPDVHCLRSARLSRRCYYRIGNQDIPCSVVNSSVHQAAACRCLPPVTRAARAAALPAGRHAASQTVMGCCEGQFFRIVIPSAEKVCFQLQT